MLEQTSFITELNIPFRFAQRPSPLAPELRPTWRVAIVLVLLRRCCRNGRASLQKLHLLNSAIRSAEGRMTLLAALAGEASPSDIIIRVEPALNRSIDFSVGEGLTKMVNGNRIELTELGRATADEIYHATDCLDLERAFIDSIGQSVTEERVTTLLQQGS